ncbi:MAG: sensor histidine kinase [Gemmatimonadaceae bacterium]
MSVARRLRIALGLNFVLLLGVVGFHLRTIGHAVSTAQALSDVSTRLMLAQARQGETIALLDASAAKFGVTHDRGYLARFEQLRAEFAAELTQAEALPVGSAERSALTALKRAWNDVVRDADAFSAAERTRAAPAAALSQLRDALAAVRVRASVVGVASREAMREHIADEEADGDRAVQVAWIAALGALILAVVTAIVLHRSIAGPLGELSRSAREVARGQFGHRIELRGSAEFTQLANAFNVMTVRLGKLDRLKQEFVATVSHDLKSPLASLRETTSLLLDQIPGPLRDAQRRVLLLQRESADRLGRMIAKLLELSRLEAGIPLAPRQLQVGDFLEKAVAHADAAGRERGVRVQVAGGALDGLRIEGDEDWLRQLVDNLLENAIKFSPPGGEVEVGAAASGGRLILSVADRGPGVEPSHAKRIFDRFYQTAAGRSVSGRGAGLGLAICREVARAHGGRISVVSRRGGGSVFVVNLPLLPDTANQRAARCIAPMAGTTA